MTECEGSWDERFEPVVEAFREQVGTYPGGGGAALAIATNGELAVDIWGGEARLGTPWQQATKVVVFSVTKGATALLLQRLCANGAIRVDAPIAQYWPRFGALGKEEITVEHLLTHTAGVGYWHGYAELLTTDGPIDAWRDVDAVANAIAAAPAVTRPGEQLFYHALTMGWIAHGLVSAVTGKSLGRSFADEIAAPLGLNLYIGAPEAVLADIADLLPFTVGPDGGEPRPRPADFAGSPQGKAVLASPRGRSYTDAIDMINDPAFRRVEQGASNGISDARSIAIMYGALADAGRWNNRTIVNERSVHEFSRVRVSGTDTNNGLYQRRALGYAVGPSEEWTASYTAFGHPGAGGNFGFANPRLGIGVGFVTNRPLLGNDRRWLRLEEALLESLDR
jgi:CubicO group peptidase (beta-lactamase class C family)